MDKPVILRGYRYSVYNRIARVVLQEKGVVYDIEEVDPFAAVLPEGYLKRHPFARVPVLSHGGFDVFETAAIARYVDAAFAGPALLPVQPEAVARVAQVVAIADNYGYRAMVRQVFAHRVFAPACGETSDEAEIAAGLASARRVLAALDAIAREGRVLDGAAFTLADCHLAPMMAYFVQAPEGARAVRQQSSLSEWWAHASRRASLQATDPGLPLP